MAYLILIRHGKSKWNELGLWTGHTEVELNDDGKKRSRARWRIHQRYHSA